MNRRNFTLPSLVLTVLLGPAGLQAQQLPEILISYPQLVLYNGKIITADDEESIVSALAIRDGKFLVVGDNNGILKLAGPKTQKIDLQGKSVVPGFIDNHGHGTWVGNVSKRGLTGRVTFKTKESGLEEIRRLVEASPPGDWITLDAPRNPAFLSVTRHDLDPIVPNNPLILITNGTDTTVNSVYLELANLPTDMLGVVKDPTTGEPTGQLFGWPAGIAMYETRPWLPLRQLVPEQKERIAERNAQGFTTILGRAQGLSISVLRELWLNNELTVRVRATHEFLRLNPYGEAYLKRLGNLSGLGDEWFKIVGATVGPVDGSAGSGAALSADPKLRLIENDAFGGLGQNKWVGHGYAGKSPNEWNGIPMDVKEQSEYQNVILANRYGWNLLSVHSVGDESTRVTLKAYEVANQEKPLQGRWGIDHQQMQTPETIALMKKLNVLPSSQYFSESHIYQYGADRASRMSPARTFIDQGIPPSVEPSRIPLETIERYVTRKGPERESQDRVFGPQEKISRMEALYMHTKWGALRSGEEELLGTIEPGKLADLVVLGGDFLGVPEDQICEQLPVLMTIVGGKIVYQNERAEPRCDSGRIPQRMAE
ncbi:amidohydrolase family protein [Acidobacteria bacterium AH-259-D05]|nr:amidohydrolase family protein [Acidobacteria bacterium AH-259-D05]